jgi:putative transcriptional regulator
MTQAVNHAFCCKASEMRIPAPVRDLGRLWDVGKGSGKPKAVRHRTHNQGREIATCQAAVQTVEIPDVKAIRKSLHMSQHRFAALYRIPLATLKNWEQGRRNPDAPAAAYLRAIQRRPKEVMEAIAK